MFARPSGLFRPFLNGFRTPRRVLPFTSMFMPPVHFRDMGSRPCGNRLSVCWVTMTRRRTVRPPSWSTIRGRVAIVLAVPTCLLLVLAGAGVADRAADWSTARRSGDRVTLALDVQSLVRELQREHGLTSGLLVGAGRYRPELADTRRRVDAIHGELVRRVAEGDVTAYEDALAGLDRLPEVRAEVDDDSIDRADGLMFFSDVIADLNDAQLAEYAGHGDQRLSDGMGALQALSGATEALARERGLMNGVFVAGRFAEGQYLEFAAARADRESALRYYGQLATDDQRAALAAVFATEEAGLVETLEEDAEAGADGSPLDADAGAWWTASTALTDRLHETQQRIGTDVADRTQELRAAATRELVGFVALGALILAVAIALAVLAARAITRPLDELTRQAENVAGHRLPETVRAIQEAEPEDAERLEPPGSTRAWAGERRKSPAWQPRCTTSNAPPSASPPSRPCCAATAPSRWPTSATATSAWSGANCA